MTMENMFTNQVVGAGDFDKNFEGAGDDVSISNLLAFTFERPVSEVPSENSFTSSCFDPNAIKRATDFLQRYKNPSESFVHSGVDSLEKGLTRLTALSRFGQRILMGSNNYYKDNKRAYTDN